MITQRHKQDLFQISLTEGKKKDCEDDHHIRTEWDVWDELVQKGYESFGEHEDAEGLQFWQEALGIFESVMNQAPETETLYGLMESQDYVYSVDG